MAWTHATAAAALLLCASAQAQYLDGKPQRRKTCNMVADSLYLSGAKREKFLNECFRITDLHNQCFEQNAQGKTGQALITATAPCKNKFLSDLATLNSLLNN